MRHACSLKLYTKGAEDGQTSRHVVIDVGGRIPLDVVAIDEAFHSLLDIRSLYEEEVIMQNKKKTA